VNCTAYILARNEEANLPRSLQALRAAQVRSVCVLDSGSTDRTGEICAQFGVAVERYGYNTHLDAYKHICLERTPAGTPVMILDADMLVSSELVSEALDYVVRGYEVVAAPVRMYWNGSPMRFGSLCPPKPFLFLGGKNYFAAAGHGERLVPGIGVARTRNFLGHDDRKPFEAFLQSQLRYSSNLIQRASQRQLSFKDHLRMRTGLLVAAVPIISYVLKGGWLSGRAGLGYAVDRMIAEAIMYRQAIASAQSDEAVARSAEPSEHAQGL